MAGPVDVVQTARQAFEDAHAHLDADLVAARTVPQARAVQDDHDRLLACYLEALRTAFECAGADWAQALVEAQAARKRLDEARTAAVDLVDRIGAMTAVAGAVRKLIDAAR